MNVAIVGLGLIGGSLARTIRRAGGHTVFGSDRDAGVLRRAEAAGAIDARLTNDNLPLCEIVLVALYPQAVVDYVRAHAALFSPGTLVIDCAGVKRCVCDPLYAEFFRAPFTFLGGHPMAGRELSGFDNARDDLFEGASMILTPGEETHPQAVARARAFFLGIGFGRVTLSAPAEHDEMIAFTSQLAHVVSSAYVKSPLSSGHRGFSAGSFLDMTRVARLNETMWTELFFDNADALSRELGALMGRLEEYRRALDARDAQTMRRLLREGREAKEALDE